MPTQEIENKINYSSTLAAVNVTNLAKTHYYNGEDVQQGKLGLTEEELKAELEANPKFALGHYSLGKIYTEQGKLDFAEREYKAAIDADPNFEGAYHELIYVYTKQGKLDLAEGVYKKVEVFNLARKHLGLGLAYMMQDKLDLAEKEFLTALAVNPGNTQDYLELILKKQKELAEELRDIRELAHKMQERVNMATEVAAKANALDLIDKMQEHVDLAVQESDKANSNFAVIREHLEAASQIENQLLQRADHIPGGAHSIWETIYNLAIDLEVMFNRGVDLVSSIFAINQQATEPVTNAEKDANGESKTDAAHSDGQGDLAGVINDHHPEL